MSLFKSAAIAGITAVALPSVAHAASQGFALSSFQSIRMEAPVRLVVRTGRGTTANAEGDRQMLDRLRLAVNGDVLTVRLAPPTAGGATPRTGSVTITVSTNRVTRVMMSGSGSVEVDRMAGQHGTIDMAGAGRLSVGAMALDRLNLTLSGSGGAKMTGIARVADLRLIGAGTIDAATLNIGQLSLIAEGTGSATLTATGSADIRALGAGDVTVTGKGACKVAHSGSGRTMCGGKEF